MGLDYSLCALPFQTLSDLLYYNDPKMIPLTDYDAASKMDYDTAIGTGGKYRFPSKSSLNGH